MAGGFPNSGFNNNQRRMVNKAMRTPNPAIRQAMLRTVKR